MGRYIESELVLNRDRTRHFFRISGPPEVHMCPFFEADPAHTCVHIIGTRSVESRIPTPFTLFHARGLYSTHGVNQVKSHPGTVFESEMIGDLTNQI